MNSDDMTKVNEMGIELKHHFHTIERSAIQPMIGGIYINQVNNVHYQLIGFLDDINQAIFKNLTTLSNEILSIHNIKNATDDKNTSVHIDINEISDKDWEKANKKYLAIKPILGGASDDYIGIAGIEKRAEEVNVSSKTLRRWINAYNTTNSIASLLDKKRGWKKGTKRLSPETDKLINDVIADYYLTIQRPSIQAATREVYKRCYQQGIPKPSKKAIVYRIEKISEQEFLKKRGYRKKAKQKYTPKAGKFPDADYPLSVVQIDHTPMDIIIVDDKHRQAIGRPFLTLAIDVYSRMVTGYYISLEAPSVTSVGMCLSRSILPKDELLNEFGIDGATWNVFGFPKKIHVDNGPDFQSNDLKKSCAIHGIDIDFRPLARPEFGGHIERILGNIMHKIHDELPGTTFSNIKQRDDYDSEKQAALTLVELETWVLTYITKVYHENIHKGIQCTPNEKWRAGIFGNEFETGIGIPATPSSPETLKRDFLPSFERTIQRNGVTVGGLTYYDPCLNNFINATDKLNGKKKKFIFRQDPRDISYLWFYDPILKSYFKVPLSNQALPAMSLWEYKDLSKKVKNESGAVNEALIYQAWEDMRKIVDEAQKNTKKVRRQEQRRKSNKKSQKAFKEVAKPTEVIPQTQANMETSIIDNDEPNFFEDIS